jgi:hypothetical protein
LRYQEGGEVDEEDDDLYDSQADSGQAAAYRVAQADIEDDTEEPVARTPDDDWEPAPEGGFKPEPGGSRFVRQGAAVEDDDWEAAPEGGFRPEPGLLESLAGGLERGVSGLAQSGELAINRLLGRETEAGTEDRSPILAAKPAPPGGMRFAQQGAAATDDDWEPAPSGGFKPEPGLWESFTGGLERGVSGAVQSGELLVNKLLGRPTEGGTEERPIAAEDIKPSEALTSPIAKGLPWLAYQTGRAAPALVGAAAGGPAGAAGIVAGSGLGQFLSDFGPRYRDALQQGTPEDQALADSLKSAGVSGAFTGASFGAFGLPGNFLKQLLIQPSIGGAETVLQNYLAGRPVTEGTGEALLGGGLGMVIPAAGHYLATRGRPSGEAKTPEQHGTPGSTAAAGTAEMQPPPSRDALTGDPQNKAVIGETGQREVGGEDLVTTGDRYAKPERTPAYTGTTADYPPAVTSPAYTGEPTSAKGPEDYGKRTPPRGAGGGMNIGAVDPTVDSAFRRESTRAPGHELDPTVAHALEQAARSEPAASVRESPPAARAPEAPIAEFRRTAQAIENNLPLPAEGMTRLWRADQPGTAGTTFTNDLPGIALPFQKQYGGGLRHVDVSTADLPRFENKAGTATFAEFNLPPEIARRARTAAAERPDDVLRGPKPELHLDQRTTGDLIQLARQPNVSDFMRQSLANELERRGIRRMPGPQAPEPPNVGAQLAAREDVARRATAAPMQRRDFRTARNPDGTWALKTQAGDVVGNYPDLGAVQRAINQTLEATRRFMGDVRGGGRLPGGRQPPDITKLTDPELHARGKDPKTTTLQREAIINELQRRQAARVQQQPAPPQPPPANRQLPGTRWERATAAAATRSPRSTAGAPPARRQPPGRSPPPPGAAPALSSRPPGIWGNLQNVFAPQLRGPLAQRVADTIRGTYGESTRLHEQTKDILSQHRPTVRNMSPDDLRTLTARAQGNTTYNPNWRPTPAQQTLLVDIKRVTDMWAQKLGTLDRASQMDWIENYLPGMYKNPNAQYFHDLGRSGGGAGSLKAKTFPDYEAARSAGLEPYTTDPIRMLELYGEKMRNFIGKQEALEKNLRDGTFIRSEPPKVVGAAGAPEPAIKSKIPPNYVESRTSPGIYMPEEVVHAWDNFHDAGLAGGRHKNLYEAVRNANSAWTNLELSFNGYHLFTMANEGIIHEVARGLEKIAGGHLLKGLGTIGGAPTAPVRLARLGSKVQGGYLDPRSTDPITKALISGGLRPIGRSHAADAKMGQQAFVKSLKNMPDQIRRILPDLGQEWRDRRGNVLGQAMYPFHLAGRVIAQVSHPLFEVYIPKLKAGAAYKQMEHWREMNPHATPEQETAAARKIVNTVDNRFGEMTSDHLFMNKVVQDMAVAGMRSFSWFMGSLKEIGGGTYSGLRGIAKRQNVLNPSSPHYDPRVAYAIAMPMTIAATSAMYQYFLGSKQPPADWRDLYAPRTGGTTRATGGGKAPEHMLMPGYHKDVHGWLAHPGTEAYSKMGGLWTTAIEEMRGRGSPAIGSPPFIRPNASFLENATDRMNYFLSKIGPIGVRAFLKGSKEGSNIPNWMLTAGFHATGQDINAPEPLQKFKDQLYQKEWDAMTRNANRDARSRGLALPYPAR